MANTQNEEFTRVPNKLLEAILATDFTKRQQKIIFLILRLSYGCGKGQALLRPSDFSAAGVHKNNIRKELDQLAAAGVITVEGNHMALNNNHHSWQLSPINSGNRLRQILHRNLADKTGTGKATGPNETRTNQPAKQEPGSYQNSNRPVDKTLAGAAPQPNGPMSPGSTERNLKTHKDSLKIDPLYDPDFQRFWEVYPKRLDKTRAYQCWQARLTEGVTAGDMVAAAANYAAYCRQQGTLDRYIKYPANFLGPDMCYRDWAGREEEALNEAARERKKNFIRSLYLR